ncbi:MLO-like protein 4, partial [Ananas comosus]
MGEGRSLAETPTWSVATVTTAMVAVCFLVERSISRFGKWLKKTKRKAMLAALEKIREELMLLGFISLMLSQTARWISEICMPSSLFSSCFYTCSKNDFEDLLSGDTESGLSNQTTLAKTFYGGSPPHQCSEGHEPFVSLEGLEQLHRFLFILGITHVLYSFVTVVLSMFKIYSWRKWENQAYPLSSQDLQGLNIYFWLSFVPAISSVAYFSEDLVMLVGTELQHVVVQLALEVVEATGPCVGTQLKPRDDLFWFGKPEILLWLIQFISFQWELSAQACFLKNHYMVIIRLVSGLLVQFWCSYCTLPLNVIITQMGSKFKKSLISESVRESLHSWCKRVKGKAKRDSSSLSRLETVRSTCSLESTVYETDETNTVGTLSRTISRASLDELATTATISSSSLSNRSRIQVT